MRRPLSDFTTPIGSGLTPSAPGVGTLSPDRAVALHARLRELALHRSRAELASRDYLIRGDHG